MKKERGLGRGLSALIADDFQLDEKKEQRIVEISCSSIEPNQSQPRRVFEESALLELKESIRVHGVLQPILVRERNDGYELIAGERRWRASMMAGLEVIPAIVRFFSDEDSAAIALIENLQREDLNQIEEAHAYRELIDRFGFTQKTIASQITKSRVHVTNTLRLLQLPKPILEWVSKGDLSAGHGRALLGLETEDAQIKGAKLSIERGFSVRQTEKWVRNAQIVSPKRINKEKNIHVRAVEEDLENALGRKVRIKTSPSGQGTISLEFYNGEDLQHLIEWMGKTEK
ncbi:stage 0 sporulation protein Spo0J [Gottschalkiaceae bacterium SANA]|nr:stage 0 sporulation protein Spo0J [Gottschalkiaceae bacterium SANA]